jgi:ribonuclease D
VTRHTILIETPEALSQALQGWLKEPSLGVDTESNSFFVYRERTCLVQVSSAEMDWIIDPFAVDITPLGELLSSPSVEKIFHACEFDVLSLKRDYRFTFANIFDTMIAAKAVGHRKVGLANLAEELLSVKLAKDEQRSDWGKRPLSKEQLDYAFADTRHLIALAAVLKEKVRAAGDFVTREVEIDCQRMTEKEPRPREVDPEAFERNKLARKMEPISRQILKSLYDAREARARELDKPPFRIVNDDAMAEIAVRRPHAISELTKIVGITPGLAARHGDLLLNAVRLGQEIGPLPFQRRPVVLPDPAEEGRFENLRAWRRAVADARGVEVEVITSNAALKTLAKVNPTSREGLQATGALDPLRSERYADGILEALRRPIPGVA